MQGELWKSAHIAAFRWLWARLMRDGTLEPNVVLSRACQGCAVFEKFDTVVVGGGQAGLAMSYYLKRLRREHALIVRGRVGERWRSVPTDEIVRFLDRSASLIDQCRRGYGFNGHKFPAPRGS